MYYKVTIDETGAAKPGAENSRFNQDVETFKTLEEVKEFIVDRYGRMPGGKNKVYRDDKSGGMGVVGFLHSYWNRDISHNSKSWFQTDWISITSIIETPVLIIGKEGAL